ncbi:hypothetical protein C0995_013274 [Termitomyces sp. Mi166|nr:hypothetical protein C0995_013274 [Termitomyces sp. Mi166\
MPLTSTEPLQQYTGPVRITPLDTFSVADVIDSLKSASESLSNIYEKLENQTSDIAKRGQIGVTSEIERFQRHLKEQDQIHKDGIAEIQRKSLLFAHLKDIGKNYQGSLHHILTLEIAQREIEAEIDQLVQKQVAECLATMIPQDLQDEIATQKVELEEFRINLLNSLNTRLEHSENRRTNASLKLDQPDMNLCEIYMTNGQVSEKYPKTLQELFDLDRE